MRINRRERLPLAMEYRAAIPGIAAMLWLVGGSGWSWWPFAVLPIAYLASATVGMLAKVHSLRIQQLQAAGGLSGVVMALLALCAGGGLMALVAGVASAFSFVNSGAVGLDREPRYEGAPDPEPSNVMHLKCAVDEVMLAYFVGVAVVPSDVAAQTMCHEAITMESVLKKQGWLDYPERFHRTPSAPQGVTTTSASFAGVGFSQLSFPSGFEPHAQLPGAAQWQAQVANQQAHLRVFRHPGAPRPWLLCIHGYRMGSDWMDLSLFSPKWLHQKLGYNLLMPVLPLHGKRKVGRKSGDDYLDGDLINLLHAQTQALWDIRRAIAWLRAAESQARIGVYGISLGGYNAALLATAESELDFIVAGIPLADMASALWRHLPEQHARFYTDNGLSQGRLREILRVVSPLARPPKVAKEKLALFAAAGDRIVTPDHPLMLSAHWNSPVAWYQGSHLSLRREVVTRKTVETAIRQAQWP